MRLYLPLSAGGVRPLKMCGEEADQLPVDVQSRLDDRHLVGHEILCGTNDRPFRKDHNPFGTTVVLWSVGAVPCETSFLLHQRCNQRRIVPAANDLSERGHIGIHFYEPTRGSGQIQDVIRSMPAV